MKSVLPILNVARLLVFALKLPAMFDVFRALETCKYQVWALESTESCWHGVERGRHFDGQFGSKDWMQGKGNSWERWNIDHVQIVSTRNSLTASLMVTAEIYGRSYIKEFLLFELPTLKLQKSPFMTPQHGRLNKGHPPCSSGQRWGSWWSHVAGDKDPGPAVGSKIVIHMLW